MNNKELGYNLSPDSSKFIRGLIFSPFTNLIFAASIKNYG